MNRESRQQEYGIISKASTLSSYYFITKLRKERVMMVINANWPDDQRMTFFDRF